MPAAVEILSPGRKQGAGSAPALPLFASLDAAPLARAKESRATYSPGGTRSVASGRSARVRGGTGSIPSASDPWSAATVHLIKADPTLAKIIREIGPCRLKRQKGGFAHLAQAVVNQQRSKTAADAIMKRLVALAGDKHLTAESLHALSDKALKSAGISARKIGYLRDLAERVLSGQLDFHRLARLSDEEVIRELSQVKGIGRWTAEMYLIFVLCRPDVLPLDDTALCSAIADLYRLKEKGDGASIAAMGETWRPYRTAASWYLWSWRNEASKGTR